MWNGTHDHILYENFSTLPVRRMPLILATVETGCKGGRNGLRATFDQDWFSDPDVAHPPFSFSRSFPFHLGQMWPWTRQGQVR